jgi:hypothetical protein
MKNLQTDIQIGLILAVCGENLADMTGRLVKIGRSEEGVKALLLPGAEMRGAQPQAQGFGVDGAVVMLGEQLGGRRGAAIKIMPAL